jgi:hypothetical protein
MSGSVAYGVDQNNKGGRKGQRAWGNLEGEVGKPVAELEGSRAGSPEAREFVMQQLRYDGLGEPQVCRVAVCVCVCV